MKLDTYIDRHWGEYHSALAGLAFRGWEAYMGKYLQLPGVNGVIKSFYGQCMTQSLWITMAALGLKRINEDDGEGSRKERTLYDFLHASLIENLDEVEGLNAVIKLLSDYEKEVQRQQRLEHAAQENQQVTPQQLEGQANVLRFQRKDD